MHKKSDKVNYLEFDRAHLWHPYTSMREPLPCFLAHSAKGACITLDDGRELIDGMSSWWCTIHGYSHPKLVQAGQAQMQTMSHVMFGGFTHAPAIELAQKLVTLTEQQLPHVFLADSGSVSVEVAMKMAQQYWYCQGQPKRQKFLTVRGGYHGDTFGCMSVCDPVNGMHHIFSQSLPQQFFAPRPISRFGEPWYMDDTQQLQSMLAQHHTEIAAIIVEPIVQGAGGMHFYHPEYCRQLRQLCDEYDILLIFDEIATGFGRTGEMFAMHHAKIFPDIMCLGKALTGGMMTLAATLANSKVAMGISDGQAPCLMHGPTFMGNPLACAVANASLELLIESNWQANVKRIENALLTGLEALREAPNVEDVRVLGAIGVVEMTQPVSMSEIQNFFVQQGVWIRPFGRLIYLMPPYIISEAQLHQLTTAISRYVKQQH